MAGKECPWCGRVNLDVYAYCQSCGRGFSEPESRKEDPQRQRWWIPKIFSGSKES